MHRIQVRRSLSVLGIAAGVTMLVSLERSGVEAQSRGGAQRPDVSGIWDPAGRCFPNGVTCPWRLEDIPVNERAAAHRRVFDEAIAPKYECAEATAPGIVGDPYMMQIEQRADRVILRFEKDDVTRTAWLDGRKPRVNEFTLQGFSVARYEGSTLVVETTNFMYDPTGLDDMAGLPSSARKKVSERYTREGDVLRAEVEHAIRMDSDLPYFAERCLKLRPKTGGMAPFLFNPAQMELHRRLDEQKAKTGKVRAVVLKARQMGISTYIAARFAFDRVAIMAPPVPEWVVRH